jgi:hypothetical protein
MVGVGILRTCNQIIAKVKGKYWKTSHKYGVQLPHSVQEALAIDKETETDFWWKAIKKGLNKVMMAMQSGLRQSSMRTILHQSPITARNCY